MISSATSGASRPHTQDQKHGVASKVSTNMLFLKCDSFAFSFVSDKISRFDGLFAII